MDRFEEKINAALNWRIEEIATLAQLETSDGGLTKKQVNVLKKHLIPNLYAYWEGFVKDACCIYLSDINELGLKSEQICPALLAFALDTTIMEYYKYSDFNKRIQKIDKIYQNIQALVLPTEISTAANLNFKVLNDICIKLNLGTLRAEQHEKDLDKLLYFRNQAAHGDFNCPVDELPVGKMRLLVIELMSSFAIHILEAYKNTVYTRTAMIKSIT